MFGICACVQAGVRTKTIIENIELFKRKQSVSFHIHQTIPSCFTIIVRLFFFLSLFYFHLNHVNFFSLSRVLFHNFSFTTFAIFCSCQFELRAQCRTFINPKIFFFRCALVKFSLFSPFLYFSYLLFSTTIGIFFSLYSILPAFILVFLTSIDLAQRCWISLIENISPSFICKNSKFYLYSNKKRHSEKLYCLSPVRLFLTWYLYSILSIYYSYFFYILSQSMVAFFFIKEYYCRGVRI